MSALLHAQTPLYLEDSVNELFQISEFPQIRNIHCQTRGSEIILRGCVTSFDSKQLAYNMARSACGMRDITNEIVVANETLVVDGPVQ